MQEKDPDLCFAWRSDSATDHTIITDDVNHYNVHGWY